MKKQSLLIVGCLIGILSVGFFGDTVGGTTVLDRTNDDSQIEEAMIDDEVKVEDIREIAYNQLPDVKKSFIQGDWQDASIEYIVVEKNGFELLNDVYLGKEVIAVNFITDPYSEPGFMMALVSKDTHELIGYGLLI